MVTEIPPEVAQYLYLAELSHKELQRRAEVAGDSFREKVLRRMAFDRDPRFPIFVDKCAVRHYVEERIGGQYLPKILAIGEQSAEIDWSAMPREFVAKLSHCSSALVGLVDGAPIDARLPDSLYGVGWSRYWIHPDSLDLRHLGDLLDHWSKMNFYWNTWRFPEWAYRDITPRILIEELLRKDKNQIATDMNFYVFHGKVEMIGVAGLGVDGDQSYDFFDAQWNQFNIRAYDGRVYPVSAVKIPKPDRLEELMELAQELAADLDFLRVDLYNLPDRILFGELTIYPSGGNLDWNSEEFDLALGRLWRQNY